MSDKQTIPPDESRQMSYRFDRQFVRNGLKRDHFWRTVYMLALFSVVVTIVLVYYWSADLHFLGPVLITASVGCVAIIAAALFRFHRAVKAVYEFFRKQSPSGVIQYQLDDEALIVEFDNGSSRFPWRDLRRLWRYPDVWLLEIVKGTSVLFPAAAASDEVKAYLVDRCRQAKVPV
jgi:hypothetical protein